MEGAPALGRVVEAGRGPAPGRPRLRVVGPSGRRRPPWPRRRVVVVAATLVVGSLLAVAGAQAWMTQEQVRLGAVQARLDTEVGQHRTLEYRLAQLSNPSQVVATAQQQGLTVPRSVEVVPATTVPPVPPGHARRTAPTGSASHPPASHRSASHPSGSPSPR